VARTLMLAYYKLRERLGRTSSVQTTAPTFVEVKGQWMPGAGAEQPSVELLDGTGARMTLRVRGDVSTLLALAQSFWRRRQ
jgi:hypothetical protein